MKKFCFVIMPFDTKYQQIYEHAIKPAVESCDYFCIRSDDPLGPRNIVKNIIENLYHADIIIADITDFNPNVYYELGIAHSFGNKTIIICNEKDNKIPFDLNNYHIIFFKDDIDGIQTKLKDNLILTIKDFDNWKDKPNNPVHDFLPDLNNKGKIDYEEYMAGEDFKFGNAVRLKKDEKIYKAKANRSDRGAVIGINIDEAKTGYKCRVQKTGKVIYNSTTFKAGERIYLRTVENGINLSNKVLTQKSELEDCYQGIGIGDISNSILIKIDNPIYFS
jgi:hypothetical protein